MIFKKRRNGTRFVSGDRVRVKSRENILELINPTNKLDGCLFMGQMWSYCGNSYLVFKVVNSIFNEHRKRTFRPKTHLYILKDIICEGMVDHFKYKCDHGCYLLWHEKWLEKV